MKRLLASRLGMLAIFAVILVGALLFTFAAQYKSKAKHDAERSDETPSSGIQAPNQPYVPEAKGQKAKLAPVEKNGRTKKPDESDSLQNFAQNMPVGTYQAEPVGHQNSEIQSIETQTIERRAARMENHSAASTANGATAKPKTTQVAMASFSRRHSQTSSNDSTPDGTEPVHKEHPLQGKEPEREHEAMPVKHYLPYGRNIKIRLVNAIVASTRYESPVVGLVEEDVKDWTDNEIVIPAGTEVHGTSLPDKQLGRLFTKSQWVLVLPKSFRTMPGGEIRLTGMALDRDETILENGVSTFSSMDASPGISGDVIKTDAEIKLMLSEAFSGFAKTAQNKDTSTTLLGTVQTVESSAKNAVLGAGASAADRYAEIALDEFRNNGWYMRVRAGKQFYLYVQQDVDMGDAKIAYMRDAGVRPSESAVTNLQK